MFADQPPPRRRVSPPSDDEAYTEPEAEPPPHEPTSRRAEPDTKPGVEQVEQPLRRSDIEPLPEVYGPGDNLRPGTDHGVWLDGRQTATLLASWYPSEFDLQRKKRAFQKANPGTDIRVRYLPR